MNCESIPWRTGTGYDVHRLVEGRKLVLGGVEIPFKKGLLGHSDADVLTHAIMDALLGAMSLGTIGSHFPDTDMQYRDIRSLDLLERVRIMMEEQGFLAGNIDSTVICDKPKLAPYINEMRMNLSEALRVPIERVSVKATTTEGLGFTGTGEGIAAQAACILVKDVIFEEPAKKAKSKSQAGKKKPADRKLPELPAVEPGSLEKCIVNIDGASDGNPGPSGIGLIFHLPDKTEIGRFCEVVGEMTGNQAEYTAAIRAAEICRKWGVRKIGLVTDSQLLERQLKGEYKVKNPGIIKLYKKLMAELEKFDSWSIAHISREKNEIADELSRLPLKKRRG